MSYLPDRVLAGSGRLTRSTTRSRAGPRTARATCRSGRSSPAATGWSPPGPARGRNRSIIVRAAARPRGRASRWALPGPTHDERSWTFDLDPGGRDPVLGIERLQEAYLARDPGLRRAASRCRRSSTSRRGQVVTNDFPQITHDLFFEWREHHRPDAPDLWPDDAARGDGRGDAARLHRGQQRRLPLRLRRLAGGLRRGVRPAVRPRSTGSRTGSPTGAT